MNIKTLKSFKLSLSTDESIREKSCGEVKSSEIFKQDFSDYHPDGIFSQKIFGPSVDYICSCKSKKGKDKKGEICNICEVLIESSIIRKDRFGHIELGFPVIHPMSTAKNKIILNTIPVIPPLLRPMFMSKEIISFLTNNKFLLNKPEIISKENEENEENDQESDSNSNIIETSNTININREIYNINYGNLNDLYLDIINYNRSLLTVVKYNNNEDFYKAFEFFSKERNSGQLKKILSSKHIRKERKCTLIIIKYENILQGIIELNPTKTNPDEVLKKVKFLIYIFSKAKEMKISEKENFKNYIAKKISKGKSEILQEKINNLFVKTKIKELEYEKPIRSINHILKGKEGRIRGNLLGKRVDYSGRSVIVVDPSLRINQCGLPYQIAIKLFQPYLIRNRYLKINAILDEFILNDSDIKDIINFNLKDYTENKIKSNILKFLEEIENPDEKTKNEIISELENIMSDKFVILNRAPTLHRMNVQSFKPVLTKSNAIGMHPLVLKSFNADIDGDQMAVHLPISFESLNEAEELLISGKYILSPRDGKPIITLSQDMILGCYYMTMIKKKSNGKRIIFSNFYEASIAFNNNIISIHTNISIRMKNEIIQNTCYGRALFNSLLPGDFKYINDNIDSKKINELILNLTLKYKEQIVIEFLEKIKLISLEYATSSGITINFNKSEIIKNKYTRIKEKHKSNESKILKKDKNLIIQNNIEAIIEGRNKTLIDFEGVMKKELEDNKGFNPINIIIKSGARGTYSNFFQILAAKGSILKGVIKNKVNMLPPFILSSYSNGLNIEEFLNTTSTSHLVLYNESMLISESGYLFRKLGLALRDLIITENDCGTKNGISKKIVKNPENKDLNYYSIYGRLSLKDIYDPKTNKLIVKKDQVIDNVILDDLFFSDIENIDIRTPFYCKASKGICRYCYGNDIAKNELISLGESIGIIAAQSISEPTSQMILKSFHTGGVIKKEDISSGIKSINGILLAQSESLKKYFTNIKSDLLLSDDKKREHIIKELLCNELINIYRENKIYINDKHLEIVCNQLKFSGGFSLKYNLRKSEPEHKTIIKNIDETHLTKSLEETYNLIRDTNKKIQNLCIIKRPQSSKYKKYNLVEKAEIELLNSKLIKIGKPTIQFIEIESICLIPQLKGLDRIIIESDGILSRMAFQDVLNNLKICIKENIIEKFDSFSSQTMIGKKLDIGKEFILKNNSK